MRSVSSITVMYDPACGLCTRVKEWMREQRAYVGIEFVATDSEQARRRFPTVPAGELAVVADTGEVWMGDRAWVVCLWALREYRDLAVRLSSPGLLRLAQEAFHLVSRNRSALSSLLRLKSEGDMELELRSVMVPRCQIEAK
jgi:predicted DCC family thiol-disulfide oxidoreductase YuxK